ncbi:MAG: hypothetical protein EP297_08695 [Gammaproteobacteria bacterium]|nr:MAG: hypothetical protein EP297_08695 [Gammaproteobacteria bacterium]
MSEINKDEGVIAALLERFEKYRLPRMLAIKEKVDNGGLLDEPDIEFLKRALDDSSQVQKLVERNPEYKDLVAQAGQIYADITAKALENEKNA